MQASAVRPTTPALGTTRQNQVISTIVRRRDSFLCRAATDGVKPIINPQTLPKNSTQVVDQAFESIKSAWQSGASRQQIEIILPIIGATDLDLWPGGIRQQFKAASPMVERLLRQLKQLPGLEGSLNARILDDGDAVGAWYGDNLGLVLFPTPETLSEIRTLADKQKNGLFLLVNPQWSTNDSGNVISDFGIFPWQKKAAADFLATFSNGYTVQNQRINGDYVQWLYTHVNGRGTWQVSVSQGPSTAQVIMQSDERPSYREVEATLRSLDWTMSSKSLMERIVAEAEFNRLSVQSPPPKDE